MPVSRSYKIQVDFRGTKECGHKATTHLYVNAGMADLAVLLHALDESEAVGSMSVYCTLTVPDLHTHGRLTGQDLGITDLKKLK